MFNPLIDKLDQFTDAELEQKILELSRKYFAAQRLGKIDLLTQIQIAIIMYKEERANRSRQKKNELDGDLDQLINVD
jgi:hypothetical protein